MRTMFVTLGLCALLCGPIGGLKQGDGARLDLVHAHDTYDAGLLHPAGLAYSPDADALLVLEARPAARVRVVTMALWDEVLGSLHVDAARVDPVNITFDSFFDRLLLYDSASEQLVAVAASDDGSLDSSPEAVTRYSLGPLGLREPQGMAVDSGTGHLYVLDSAAPQLVRVAPDAKGRLGAAAALDDGRVHRVDLLATDLVQPRGLAQNPANGHLYLVSPVSRRVYELLATGEVVAALPLPADELSDPRGLAFAPSADTTDDPSTVHLFIADTGLDPAKRTAAPGTILELSLANSGSAPWCVCCSTACGASPCAAADPRIGTRLPRGRAGWEFLVSVFGDTMCGPGAQALCRPGLSCPR